MHIAVNMFDPFKCMVHDSDSGGRGRHLNLRVLAEVMVWYGIVSLSLALTQSHTDTHRHKKTNTRILTHIQIHRQLSTQVVKRTCRPYNTLIE